MKTFFLLLALPLYASADCVDLIKQIRAETYAKYRSVESLHGKIKSNMDASGMDDELYYYVEKSNQLASLNLRYDVECTNETVPEEIINAPVEPGEQQ